MEKSPHNALIRKKSKKGVPTLHYYCVPAAHTRDTTLIVAVSRVSLLTGVHTVSRLVTWLGLCSVNKNRSNDPNCVGRTRETQLGA